MKGITTNCDTIFGLSFVIAMLISVRVNSLSICNGLIAFN